MSKITMHSRCVLVIKDLSIRSYTCPKCGTKLKRDENAAKNILAEAIKQIKAGAQPDNLLILESLDSLSKKPPLQSNFIA